MFVSLISLVNPERLVHGPLTALMLLEIAARAHPDDMIEKFEYRATNPVVVARPVRICAGTRDDDGTMTVWAEETESQTIGMTGKVTFASAAR